jgi:hypothetical protein
VVGLCARGTRTCGSRSTPGWSEGCGVRPRVGERCRCPARGQRRGAPGPASSPLRGCRGSTLDVTRDTNDCSCREAALGTTPPPPGPRIRRQRRRAGTGGPRRTARSVTLAESIVRTCAISPVSVTRARQSWGGTRARWSRACQAPSPCAAPIPASDRQSSHNEPVWSSRKMASGPTLFARSAESLGKGFVPRTGGLALCRSMGSPSHSLFSAC